MDLRLDDRKGLYMYYAHACGWVNDCFPPPALNFDCCRLLFNGLTARPGDNSASRRLRGGCPATRKGIRKEWQRRRILFDFSPDECWFDAYGWIGNGDGQEVLYREGSQKAAVDGWCMVYGGGVELATTVEHEHWLLIKVVD